MPIQWTFEEFLWAQGIDDYLGWHPFMTRYAGRLTPD